MNMCCTESQGTIGWSQWLSYSIQAGECIVKITDQVFSLDDVITGTKPIYRYKETGHPNMQAPKIHALRDEFINLGFVRPSTSLREGISPHDFFQAASVNSLEPWNCQNDKIIKKLGIRVCRPLRSTRYATNL